MAMMAEKVTRDDLKVIVKKLFKVIDTNQNDRLERSELLAFFQQMSEQHNEPFSESDFDDNWKRMDNDMSNDISEDEFYQYMLNKAKAGGNLVG